MALNFFSVYVCIGIVFWLCIILTLVTSRVIFQNDSPELRRMFGFFTMLFGGISTIAFWPLHLIAIAVILSGKGRR